MVHANLNRLWGDPSYEPGWNLNTTRNISHTFGPDVLRSFLRTYDLDLVCRAHMQVEDGYEFFANRQLVTVFSAPNYCDRDDEVLAFPNAAAILCVDGTLMCSFQILKPETFGGEGGAAAARPVEEEEEEEAGARLVQWGNLEEAEVQQFQPCEYVTDAEFEKPRVPHVDQAAADDFIRMMSMNPSGAVDDD